MTPGELLFTPSGGAFHPSGPQPRSGGRPPRTSKAIRRGLDGRFDRNTLPVCRNLTGIVSCVMRNHTPLAPGEPAFDVTVHIVLNDFGDRLGRAYCETDEAAAAETSIIENIIDGEYSCPMRVVAFNTAEGWSRDVTEEIAARLLDLNAQGRMLGASARDFVERVTGRAVTVVV